MIIWDTETTSLLQPEAVPLDQQPRLIEFAGIKLADEPPYKELGRLEFLCAPGILLPEIIVKITGLTDEKLKDAPEFARVYPALCDFWRGEVISIAHNHDFDLGILSLALRRIGKQYAFPWTSRQICTAEASRSIAGHRLKLAELHEQATGKSHKEAHRAMPDAEGLVTCLRFMIKDGIIKI